MGDDVFRLWFETHVGLVWHSVAEDFEAVEIDD